MAPIRRLVVDLLKPHEPEISEIARRVADIEGVNGVNATLVETDREVENIKLTIEGEAINETSVMDEIETLGASLHSVDQVIAGEHLVPDSQTPQD